MLIALLSLSSYAQTEPQHVYLKLYNDGATSSYVEINPTDDGSDFSYMNYGEVDTETATLKLTEDDDTGFHTQLTLMSDVSSLFIRFGISLDGNDRIYSLNNSKLFYNQGHIEVSEGGTIDIYYDGNNLYQMRYDNIIVECAEIEQPFSGIPKAFVSSYGRPNIGSEVYFMLDSYPDNDDNIVLEECPSACAESPDRTSNISELQVPPTCNSTSPPNCLARLETDIHQAYFEVYPNPANHQITLEVVPLSDEVITINIVDGLGRIVQHRSERVLQDNEHIFHFDVRQLTEGIYYIKIDSGYRFEAQKITIIK